MKISFYVVKEEEMRLGKFFDKAYFFRFGNDLQVVDVTLYKVCSTLDASSASDTIVGVGSSGRRHS